MRLEIRTSSIPPKDAESFAREVLPEGFWKGGGWGGGTLTRESTPSCALRLSPHEKISFCDVTTCAVAVKNGPKRSETVRNGPKRSTVVTNARAGSRAGVHDGVEVAERDRRDVLVPEREPRSFSTVSVTGETRAFTRVSTTDKTRHVHRQQTQPPVRSAGRDETCPISTGGGTRRVQSVQEGGGGEREAEADRSASTGAARWSSPPSGVAYLRE